MAPDIPDFPAARDHVVRAVTGFGRQLRAEGVAVPATAALPAVEALTETGLDDRDRVRAALHAVLVQRPEDRDAFDEAFPEFWYRLRTGLEATATSDDTGESAGDADERADRVTTDADGTLADASGDAPFEGASYPSVDERTVESRQVADAAETPADRFGADHRAGTYSAVGDRTEVGDDETGSAAVGEATMRRFERALATASGRRWSASPTGEAVDARRALRESMDTGGVTLRLPTRERKRSAFRTCVLVDVSRSVLDAVDRRFLLSMLAALVTDGRSVRVFFFDTDVREVTDVFAESRGDPEAALERAAVAWGGGTRIGTSLLTLRRRWPDAVGRRTVTLVVSDGLDVGDIEDLEEGMSWLARRSRALVWLNPLATSSAWEPTCRGMEVAEPYVDGVFAFGGNDDLDDAARQLLRRGPRGPVGYEYDFRDRTGGATSG